MMRRNRRTRWAVILVLALTMGCLPGQDHVRAKEASAFAEEVSASTDIQADYGLSNPTTDKNGVTTWDCVWFGNYRQEDTNEDGKVDQTDEQTPIKWRVLSVDGDDAFLLADKCLDCYKYNTRSVDVTWETCTIRSWLNGYGTDKNVEGTDYSVNNFINTAFEPSEQTAIRDTTVVNANNPSYGTSGGNNTTDKIYFLSLGEVTNSKYGFTSTVVTTKTRGAKNTKYATECGAYTCNTGGYAGNGCWWLRSPGYTSYTAFFVYDHGYVTENGGSVDDGSIAVRPALHLNLSSVSVWSKAGTVSSSGESSETPPVPPVTQSPTPTATADTQADYGLSNPTTDEEGVTTWDCIEFGHYWQEDTNGDEEANQNDDKTPIKWRVLSMDGDDAFLLADKCLDCQKYNATDTNVTWETCTIRSWLNGYSADQNQNAVDYHTNNFINTAFEPSEQAAIKDTMVVNEKNPQFNTPGGSDTTDKIYLLSPSEVMNPEYGFSTTYTGNKAREAKNTTYAKSRGAYTETAIGNGYWWLRSPGDDSGYASYVYSSGGVNRGGSNVNITYVAVRPALHLNLSSVSVWSKAGTVSSSGESSETPPVPPATPSSTPTATVTPTPVATALPTISPIVSGTPTETPTIPPVTTVSPSPTPVATVTPTPVATALPTISPIVSGTPTETPTMPPALTEPPFPPPAVVITLPPAVTASPTPPPVPAASGTAAAPNKTPVPTKSPVPDSGLSTIVDELGVSEDTAAKIQTVAGELDVSMDTILVTEQMIQSQKTDDDIKGSYFARLQARASQITQNNIKLSWNRVKGADGYEVYGNRCNTKKWIYEYKKMKTIENGNKKSFIDRNCKKGTYYKYIVRAYKIIDGKKVTIAASKTIHVTTTGGKNGNAKSVKVNKKKVSLKAGKKFKLKASEMKESKPLRHHREVSYESSAPDVVTVSKTGRIKAKKKGKCIIFAYAQSGIFRKIKVTVK